METISFPNAADIFALIIIAIGMIRGFVRGLSGELGHLLGVVAAFLSSILLYDKAALWMAEHMRLGEKEAGALSFVATFILAWLVVLIVSRIVRYIVRSSLQEKTDRIWGALLGIIKSIIIVLAIFIALNLWPNDYINRVFGRESVIGYFVVRVMPQVRTEIESTIDRENEPHNNRDKAGDNL